MKTLKWIRVFQIDIRDGGAKEILLGDYFVGWWDFKEWLKNQTFFKAKILLCKYWTSIKTKISMRSMYKEYKVKITVVQTGAINTAKNEVFIGL